MLYFDLRYQQQELKDSSTSIDLKYTLTDQPDAAYTLYALVLHEVDVRLDVESPRC